VQAVIRLAAPRRYPRRRIRGDDTVKPTTAGILRARRRTKTKPLSNLAAGPPPRLRG